MPFPVPGLPDVTASHAALLAAVHWQCAAAVTAKLPDPLSLPSDALPGEISIAQLPRPSSTTDTVWPAIVSVPVRAASDGFAVRLTLTAPVPVPLAPLVIDIQPRSEVAVQVH